MSASFKIVVPTDFSKGSEAALDWVNRLSVGGPTEIHCINVVQEPMMYMPVAAGTALQAIPPVNELERISGESLDVFVKNHLGDADPAPVTKVLRGRPAEEITGYAKEIGADIIVIATRGQSGLAHMMMGSTAEGVVRAAECPVLTIRG